MSTVEFNKMFNAALLEMGERPSGDNKKSVALLHDAGNLAQQLVEALDGEPPELGAAPVDQGAYRTATAGFKGAVEDYRTCLGQLTKVGDIPGGNGTEAPRGTGGTGRTYGGYTVLPIPMEMDLETIMMFVQTSRANLLESSLRDQLLAIQGRNTEIAEMNDMMNLLRAKMPNIDSKTKEITFDSSNDNDKKLKAFLEKGGYFAGGKWDNDGKKFTPPNDQTAVQWIGGTNDSIKSKVDSLNSTQQLDMMRMQSLMNKRNEAFDQLTNFIKKHNDQLGTIIGNMR